MYLQTTHINKVVVSIIFLCKYFLVIWDTQVDSFLDVLFLLVAVILPELQ